MMSETQMTEGHGTPRRRRLQPVQIVVIVATLVLALGGLGLGLQRQRSNQPTALERQAKGVTLVAAVAAEFRPEHRYIGTIQPWNEAKVGPQFDSAYVTQVLVRPGDTVRRGQVLARLEPERARNQSTTTKLQADAIEARLAAIRHESERIVGLMKKGIVSVNDAENKLAEAKSEEAKLGAAKSQLATSDLEVSDSTLLAPFEGEVADRLLDPGAFVHPGMPIVTVVDRRTVRVSAEAPEADFDLVSPGTLVRIRLAAANREIKAPVARRSPAADPSTRTIHFELDLANADRSLPVGTTAELLVTQKRGESAVALPAAAVEARGSKATVWVVEGGVAHRHVVALLGEVEGRLFLDPGLRPGSQVVLEGRNLLQDGDRVVARSRP
jgi:membrane fusion protein (multidrug efflux system)